MSITFKEPADADAIKKALHRLLKVAASQMPTGIATLTIADRIRQIVEVNVPDHPSDEYERLTSAIQNLKHVYKLDVLWANT